ncbi:MAG: hypothetical protein RBS99_16035 [Rhodospirillales bacterium]|nr:hypothetical protein [Rhodospirillales bacterium]
MPGLNEILRSLYGAYRLARFDAGGLTHFDATPGGFWKSFFAAVIVAPLYLILLAVRIENGPADIESARLLAVESIAYVIGWVIYPLVMATVARLIDRERHYVRYIVAYNWTSVWQNVIYLPIAILSVAGLLTGGAGGLLAVAGLIVVLVYAWFVARTALDIPGLFAVPLVGLDITLGLMLNSFADGLIHLQ